MINYLKCSFPLGELHLYADSEYLLSISFKKDSILGKISNNKENAILKKAAKELKEYFVCKRTRFNLPLKLSGTEFQKNVWDALSNIPYGETKSYQDLAKLIKKPKAQRAVGTANGKNNFPIIIPCHRVIKSSGEIGGYSGGVKIKNFLLNLEKQAIGPSKN